MTVGTNISWCFFLEQRFLYFSNIHILVFGNMCITKVMVSQHIHVYNISCLSHILQMQLVMTQIFSW